MVRMTNHDRLECHRPEPLRFGHPQDGTLDLLAEQIIKRQRGYRETKDGINPKDPALARLRIQLRSERDVARYLMVPYRPEVDDRDRRYHLRSKHGVPVEVICRQRKTDPKGRHSMPELLLPVEWKPEPGLAVVFAVWCGEGCAPYLAGWAWEEEIRQGPSVIYGSRVFKRRPVSQLHDMQRLVVASPYVPTRQMVLGREEAA